MHRIPANRIFCFLLPAGIGVFADLYTKYTVFNSLGYPHQASDWKYSWFNGQITFQLFTSFNHGALWGIGQGMTWLFAALSFVAIIGVIYWLFFAGAARSLWLTFSLGLIMAGTLGNLFDRLGLPGYLNAKTGEVIHAVRDFLYFTFGSFHWPVFNFADVFLVTGAIMLVLHSFQAEMEGHAADVRAKQDQATLKSTQPSGTTVPAQQDPAGKDQALSADKAGTVSDAAESVAAN